MPAPTMTEQLRAQIETLRIGLEGIQKDIAFEAMRAIVQGGEFGATYGTPVKTGLARGSWHVRFDGPMPDPPGPPDPSGEATLAAAGTELLAAVLGKPVWFVNGTSYAIYLEYGTMFMLPFAMVRSVVVSWHDLVAASVLKFQQAGFPVRTAA